MRRAQAERKTYTDTRGDTRSTVTRQANPLNFPLLMHLIADGDAPEIDLSGFPEPRSDMSDARRKLVRQRRAQAVRNNERIRLLNLRDRALLALAYDSKARRSEWVAITPADITETGLGWTITLTKTKTNQGGGEPEIKVIRPEFVRLVHDWMRAAGLFHDPAAVTSPILRRIGRHGHVGRPLSDQNLVEIIRAWALRADVERHIAEGLTGHSTRVGVIQDMVASRLGTAEVQIESGHKTAVMLNRYARKLLAARGAGQKLVEAQAAQLRAALETD